MASSFRSFFIQLFLFSIATAGVVFFWQQNAPARFQTNLGFLLWAFFIFVTAAMHIILVQAAKESSKKFITYFMALTGAKLFAYLIIILIYALIKGHEALGFVVLFLILYFFYSAFEVVILLRHLKK